MIWLIQYNEYGEDFMSGEVKLFEGNTIRSVWDNEKEEWYFSVVDVVGAFMKRKKRIMKNLNSGRNAESVPEKIILKTMGLSKG